MSDELTRQLRELGELSPSPSQADLAVARARLALAAVMSADAGDPAVATESPSRKYDRHGNLGPTIGPVVRSRSVTRRTRRLLKTANAVFKLAPWTTALQLTLRPVAAVCRSTWLIPLTAAAVLAGLLVSVNTFDEDDQVVVLQGGTTQTFERVTGRTLRKGLDVVRGEPASSYGRNGAISDDFGRMPYGGADPYSQRYRGRSGDNEGEGLFAKTQGLWEAWSGKDRTVNNLRQLGLAMLQDSVAPQAVENETGSEAATAPAQTAATRTPQVIYEARINLVVSDFSQFASKVGPTVTLHGGYVVESVQAGQTGEKRTGEWKMRVPVDRFEAFQLALAGQGIVESRSQTAEDVTEQFVDIEARVASAQQLEARILKLLENVDDKISEVIEVEQQLARVRSEIEQMQGRLRLLANRTVYSLVVVDVREERSYVPPTTPGFSGRAEAVWSESVVSLRRASENFLLWIVKLSPWLLVWLILLGCVLGIFAVRRRFKRGIKVRG